MIKNVTEYKLMPKLWTKVVLSVALVQIPLFILATFLYVQEVRKDYIEKVGWHSLTLSQQLQKRAADLSGYSPEMQRTLGLNIESQSLLNDNIKEGVIHIGVIGLDGKTIASTDSSRLDQIEFKDEVKGIYGKPTPSSTFITSDSYETLIPIYNAGHPSPVAVIYIGFSKQAVVLKIVNTIKYAIILYFIFLLLSSVLISTLLRYYVTQPISELSKAAANLANVNLDTNIPKAYSYEVALLAHSFANMSKSITEKLAAMKESEERFSLAMQGANDGLWDWNIKTNVVYYSPRWKSMLGYAENEVKPHLSAGTELLHKDDINKVLSEVEACVNGSKEKYEVEFRMQHKDGQYIDILSRAFVVKDEKGVINRLVGTHVDITSRKKADEYLSYQASHDPLTNLVNRREFENRAGRLLSTTKHESDEHALCFMDLDQFKVINDTCGHVAGDEMLRQLSTVLQETMSERDTLARLGGDEFGVLMEHRSLDDAHRVAISLQETIQNYQFVWEGYSFKIGVSMGLIPITKTTVNLTELLIDADAACYMAKDNGRNRIHIYHADDSEIAHRHGEMQWVTRIQHALEEDRFCLYAQSIMPLDNNTDKHYELLIRMIDEKGKVIPPGAFLPAAERYDLMTQIDRWVIESAFRLLADNPVFESQVSFISINLSGQSLADQSILDFIILQLDETGIESKNICFEITETAAILNLGTAKIFISTLKELGCRFALDDFGSGLSSFAYLKNLSVDYLKIDGMFVKDIVDDPIDHAMVKSINEIGHVMGMKTIAEFVENDEIKGMLGQIGVDYAQGYGIDKPMPLDDLLS